MRPSISPKLLSFCLLIFLGLPTVLAQESLWVEESLHISNQAQQSRVYPRNRFVSQSRAANSTQAFLVDYNGFTPAAQAALQYAVDIWGAELFGNVPINVQASFSNLGATTLATTNVNLIYSGNASLPIPGAFYPSALVNQYAACDLAPATVDIIINFNSNINWYFGTDLATPITQYDFVTVALHELGHGLGFFGTGKFDDGLGAQECNGTANNGCIGLPNGPINYSGNLMIYDEFVANSGGNAIKTFTNPSGAMGFQLTGDDLFWQGANGLAANGGMGPKLYVPATFDESTSYMHLDEATFPAGNPHSLMTPIIGAGEAIHDLGDIARGMLQDMGWTLANLPQTRFDARDVAYTGLTHTFADVSAQAVSWAWDFENDGFADATGQNPTHVFPAAGTYTTELEINGNPALTYQQNITVYDIPNIPFLLDFNLNESGFYPNGASCDQWEWSDGTGKNSYKPSNFPVPQFGSHSWFTRANGNHGANGLYYLETMPMNFVGAVGDYFLEFEFRAALSTDAGMNMEYSVDGGNTWQILGPLGAADPDAINDWYDQTNVVGLGGEPGWAPSTAQAFNIFNPNFRINVVKGFADVRFRLKFGSSTSNFLDGFQVDNFEINGSVLNAEDLISLEGRQQNGKHFLQWESQLPASDVKQFQIERALDNGDFIAVETVGATKNQTLIIPLPGNNRYRIRQLAKNGQLSWSDVLELQHHQAQSIRLYPNPADEQLSFQWYNPNGEAAKLVLFNTQGQMVLHKSIQQSGLVEQSFDISSLPAGMYQYQLQTESTQQSGKLMIR
ncbi:MAG: T9SS type A sorting domain-containing protein [Bacteroidota bacterium]